MIFLKRHAADERSEHHNLNSTDLHYYGVEAEHPEQIKPKLFVWLDSTCGGKKVIWLDLSVSLSPSLSWTCVQYECANIVTLQRQESM